MEIASGASWHPSADLYSFTKVRIIDGANKLLIVMSGSCLGIVQRFYPPEGRDWPRGIWASEES